MERRGAEGGKGVDDDCLLRYSFDENFFLIVQLSCLYSY